MSSEERIRFILDETGLKAATFAGYIGVPRFKIADIKCGKTKTISPELCKAICRKFPQFSPTWILTGEGDAIINQKVSSGQIINNPSGGNNSQTQSTGVSEETFLKLLEELAAQRRQTQDLIDIIKDKLK